MRRNTTDIEKLLWSGLRRHIVLPHSHFRRQVAIGPYIVDFCCLALKLVIECDGDQHGVDEAIRYDGQRDHYLKNAGYHVLRFWNHEVRQNFSGVLDTIFIAVTEQAVLHPSRLVGAGGGPERSED